MSVSMGKAKEKISLHDGEILLEAFDSQNRILAVSLVGHKGERETMIIEFHTSREMENFINFLNKMKKVRKNQVRKFESMVMKVPPVQ